MSNLRNRIGRILGYIFGGLIVLVVLYFGLFYVTCYSPTRSAESAAREHAAASGYRMAGYLGEIMEEPNAMGGCAVKIKFLDLAVPPEKASTVTMHLRRTFFLGSWTVFEVSVEAAKSK